MDRITGWFWNTSSKQDQNQQSETPKKEDNIAPERKPTIEGRTDDKSNNSPKLDEKTESKISTKADNKESEIITKKESTVNKSGNGWSWNFWKSSSKTENTEDQSNNAEQAGNQSNNAEKLGNQTNAQANVTDNFKPVLYEKLDQSSIKVKLSLWLQKHTYFQPQDCLLCKLTLTGSATLILLTGINLINGSYQQQMKLLSDDLRKQRLKNTRRITLFISFGCYLSALYGEWYNALFVPPGNLPRSFIQREFDRMHKASEYLGKNKETKTENDQKDEGS